MSISIVLLINPAYKFFKILRELHVDCQKLYPAYDAILLTYEIN
jgi:hypothetical protein